MNENRRPALRILVPIDFSDCSRAAVDWAVRHANAFVPSELTFLHVIERTTGDDDLLRPAALAELESDAEQMKDLATVEMKNALAGRPLAPEVSVRYAVAHGKAYVEILKAASQIGADLVILGTHGRTGLERLLIGSVAERVVRGAPSTVITVKPKSAAAPNAAPAS